MKPFRIKFADKILHIWSNFTLLIYDRSYVYIHMYGFEVP
jgi:hypothetical protein